ncbi:MAG: p13-like protein [Harvfovirus sp.]|uniref:p13-like protein n=1 Tax=Harvfovirus sp. TaxID=2487768 RepID=A0A3G4ZZZ1_9VIRU|nr:MAG: p13-like protein [Harvfovirus sp.]
MANICRYTNAFSGKLAENKRYAFILTMFLGDNYLPGLLCCAALLKSQIKSENYKNIDVVAQLTLDSYRLVKDVVGLVVDVIKIVPYINATGVILERKLRQKPAYGYVFTKLWGLTYTEYDKIILIDIDFLPMKRFCDLFKLVSPSGALEAPVKYDPKNASNIWESIYCNCCNYNMPIPPFLLLYFLFFKQTKFYAKGFQFGGLNASLFVLTPNVTEFKSIMNEINNYQSDIKWTLPEQQYLTLRWSFGKLNPGENEDKINKEIDSTYKFLVGETAHKKILDLLDVDEKEFRDELKEIYFNVVDSVHLSDTVGPWHGIHPTFYSSVYDEIPQPNGIGFFSNKKPWQLSAADVKFNLNKEYGLKEWYSYFYKILVVLMPKIQNKKLLDYLKLCESIKKELYEYPDVEFTLVRDSRIEKIINSDFPKLFFLNVPSVNYKHKYNKYKSKYLNSRKKLQ